MLLQFDHDHPTAVALFLKDDLRENGAENAAFYLWKPLMRKITRFRHKQQKIF